MKINKLFIVLAGVTSACFSQQQNLSKNYEPLKSSGPLPAVFTQAARDMVKKDISDLRKNKEEDRAIKSVFVTASGYEIENIAHSGDMLMNDEVTVYLNLLADEILKNNPVLRKQLNIFALKSPVVNAYSYDKGYIFINLGLIAQAQSEAQLAFVLCHEIAHYTKQHSITSYVVNKKLDKKKKKNGNYADRKIEKCQYSRENESEADLEGFKLFEQSRYNIKDAELVFNMLQYSHLPFELVKFKKDFLETAGYNISEDYFLKEESPIMDNSNENDSLHTHPNSAKRRLAIGKLAAGKDNNGKISSVIGQQKFEYIRDLSRMELCRLYLKRRDYPNAFYAAYVLSSRYKDNEYLAEVISKSLYGITLYRKDIIQYNTSSYLPDGIKNYSDIESYPQQIYYMIDKMPANEWVFLSLNYCYRAHKKFPDNEKIAVLSDSLFRLVKTCSNTVDFASSDQSDTIVKPGTTGYYKSMFADLFNSDREFSDKFAMQCKPSALAGSFKTYSEYDQEKKVKAKDGKKRTVKVSKVLVLEPGYIRVDHSFKQPFRYFESDEKQERYVAMLKKYATKRNLSALILDPGQVAENEPEKINDYSVLNDWLDEYIDSDKSGHAVLNTSEINSIVSKYGTPYVLKLGVVSVDRRTVFYGLVVDLRNSVLIYRQYRMSSGRDRDNRVKRKTRKFLSKII